MHINYFNYLSTQQRCKSRDNNEEEVVVDSHDCYAFCIFFLLIISITIFVIILSFKKFLDYLKVYRQFEKNSDACISKDEMNNQRS